jgi:SHC-transforming protein 1
MNYVAYVAKDIMEWRACYVIDCGSDRAQTVISTMGQAFELRYKNFCNDDAERMSTLKRKQQLADCMNPKCEHQEYYNDLPNKMPPEFDDVCGEPRRERLPSNLIDLNEHDYVNEDANKHCVGGGGGGSSGADGFSFNSNNNNNNNGSRSSQPFSSADVFDIPNYGKSFPLSAEVQRSQLLIECWFHGPISRTMAEEKLKNDGDFLVRQSQGTPGQFVLSGLNGTPKHLLLIDPEGVVRTKDRIFESITHLINYHWTNKLPIISSDSCLLLRTPVIRTTDLRM